MFCIDITLATVEVAVLFERQGVAAALAENAQRLGCAKPGRQRRLEEVDIDAPHIAAHPLVIDRAQKLAPLLGRHRAAANGRAVRLQTAGLWTADVLVCPRTAGVLACPWTAGVLVCPRTADVLVCPSLPLLHNRDELHPFAADLVAQEAIDLQRMSDVGRIYAGQCIKIDPMRPQQGSSGRHSGLDGWAALVHALHIEAGRWTLDAQFDQKIVVA